MIAIAVALLIFITVVVAHLLYCRNQDQGILYAKVFIGMAMSGFILLIILFSGLTTGLKWSAALIYLLLIPVYLIFYVTTVLVSPSKRILQIIKANSQINYPDILRELEKENFITSRLKELVESGCARLENGRYVLTPTGHKTAALLDRYQKMLGRAMGG